jgi:hypothetical protein
METPYTYLFIRKDLSIPQQIVQASHAALEAGHRFGEHSHLVCIGVDGETKLHQAACLLDDLGINYQMFHETDIGQNTAICTTPLRGDERKPMKKFKLYKEVS